MKAITENKVLNIPPRTPGFFALLCLCFVLFLSVGTAVAQNFSLSANAQFTLTPGSVFSVNGGIRIAANATLRQNGSGSIRLSGNWHNDGSFVAGSGFVRFYNAATQTISGNSLSNFYELQIDKNAPANLVLLDADVRVQSDLYVSTATLRFINNANRRLTLDNDIYISSDATFDVAAGGSAGHQLRINGSLYNENVLDFTPGGSVADIVFIGGANSVISGSGGTSDFNEITIAKNAANDTVRVESGSFSAPATGFLTLNTGVFHLAGVFGFTNPVFTTASYSIPVGTGLWVDNANVTVSGRNGDALLAGSLHISDGVYNVGSGSNENNLLYANGAKFTLDNGTVNINARFSRDANDNAGINYTQRGGQLNIGVGARGTNANRAMFDIGHVSSSFTWSAGTIELQRIVDGANNLIEYRNLAGSRVVSGGILRIDNEDAANSRFDVDTEVPIGELLMIGTNRARVRLDNNDLYVLGNITIAGNGQNRLIANSQDIYLGGNWVNNGNNADAFDHGSSSRVTFNGGDLQTIGGSNPTTFYELAINQSPADTVRLELESGCDSHLRIISNSKLDIVTHNFTVGPGARIYSNNGTLQNFNASKNVFSAAGSNAGLLIRELAQGGSTPIKLLFPLGTPGIYAPGEVEFLLNKATFNAGAYVSMKVINEEHPAVELNDVSLKQYWVVTSANIALQSAGANVLFYYNANAVEGNEGSYVVLYFSPSWPDAGGFWQIEPGRSDDVVDFNTKLFYSQQVDAINGDWTAGQEDAGQATYFSRTNGDYNTPSTWSRVNHTGPPSATAPNKQSDRVFIKGHTVSVNGPVAPANVVALQANSELRIEGDYVFTGDSMRVESNTVLSIGHTNGIAGFGSSGAVQTTVRSFSDNAVYKFIGTQDLQVSGNGVPSPVRSVMVDKPNGDTLRLSKQIEIKDSLVINGGSLDLASYSMNGSSSGRSMRMRGGELIVRNTFPTNYTPPVFTAGTVSFDGTGSVTIPSTFSGTGTPGVSQYYRVKIAGTRNGNVTLRSQGEIRISNDLDISQLSFTGASGFLPGSSTVNFNGTGSQQIPARPLAPADSTFNLNYNRLRLSGNGTKLLSSAVATTFVVTSELILESGATLESNGFNMELRGNWTNNGGIFDPGNELVTFRSPSPLLSINVLSGNTTNNPFNNVRCAGEGIVQVVDNMLIRGNLTIVPTSTLKLTSFTLTLNGNWNNLGGSFTPGTSTVVFSNTASQTMSVASGNQTFYNLTLNNPGGLDASGFGGGADAGLVVQNTLNLSSGILDVRGHHATALGTVQRPGVAPGHVDGQMRKNIATGSPTVVFQVGYGTQYTPVTLEFAGSGGTAGLLGVLSDTVTAASSPVSTGITPAGSELDDVEQVRRQYTVAKPTGSGFALGLNRTYDATMQFIGAPAPAGDLRNGANTVLFEPRLWAGSAWVLPNRFDKPLVGTRTDSSTEYRLLTQLGTLIIGEPIYPNFYSIVDGGNWTTPASWSTEGYDGPPTSVVPDGDVNVFIGNGKTINLDAGATVNGILTVDSSGVLMCAANVIGGSGEFRLESDGTLGVGSTNGIRTSGSGNIQTSIRNYNPGSHNNGHFIYTGSSSGQSTGNGLPSIVATLRVSKSGGATVTLDNPVSVSDTVQVLTGDLRLSDQLTLNGDFIVETTATFTPAGETVVISGSTTQIIRAAGATLDFHNLTISKANSDNVLLSTNTNIEIAGTLTLSAGNTAYIDARSFTSCHVTVLGSVTRTGAGHIDGELRKNVGSGNTTVVFEVGNGTAYTPFTFQLSGSGGTAGLVAMNVPTGKHPYLDDTYSPPIDPDRFIPRWWRLTRPSGSAFARGTRDITPTVRFLDPDDVQTVDAAACCDMAFWRGQNQSWQALYPNSGAANYPAGFGCGDSRLTLGEFDYDGSSNSVTVNDIPSDSALGSTKTFSDGSLLLGDFVTGNQNSISITTFYSRGNGDWGDPNSWSTVSYNGVPAFRYPNTQYDIVFIGNNRRIEMDRNIGTAWLYGGGAIENSFYGPAVTVENTGTLALGDFVLRGVAFTAEKGSTLEVGSHDGIVTQGTGRGNVMSYSRSYEDSINVVYTGSGYTPDFGGSLTYCKPTWNAGTYYIDRVRIQQGTSGPIIFNHESDGGSANGIFYWADSVVYLTAGQSYRFILNQSASDSKRWRVWIDYDRDGSLEDNSERVIDNTSSSSQYTSPTFTVPAGTNPGVTRMRVQMRNGTGTSSACSGSTGEVEDYTVVIVNNGIQVAQNTGNGLPGSLWSLEVNSSRTTPSTLDLGKNIMVRDSFLLTRGYFDAGNNDIAVEKDFINNFATNAFDAGSGTVEFVNYGTARIRGTARTVFNDVNLNKVGTRTLVATDAAIEGELRFDQNNFLRLEPDVTLTFGVNAVINDGGPGFSNTRMIRSDGSANAGVLVKRFTTAPGVKSFNFPVGIDTIYNPATISVNGSYTGVPAFGVRLVNGLHPERNLDDMVKKYWTVTSANISNITSSYLEFHYIDADTVGNASIYIPAVYTVADGWEINVGTNPKGNPSPIEVTDVPSIDGDWTAGGKLVFFVGRIFYSRNNGNWSEQTSWSNVSHNGPPASYYPFELYTADSVYIDGHTITYDLDSAAVDTINIGGSFNGTDAAGRGILEFGPTPLSKYLRVNGSLMLESDGRIQGSVTAGRRDTLALLQSLRNDGAAVANAGVFLHSGADAYTFLRFIGSDNSAITGEGVWGDVGPLILDKDGGLADSLINRSVSFASATGTVAAYHFHPFAGVLQQAATGASLSLSYGSNNVDMAPFTGIDVREGLVRSSSNLISNVNTSIRLRGGDLYVGDAIDEHFQYRANTTIHIEDGLMNVAGYFGYLSTPVTLLYTQSSNGTVRVLTQGNTDISRSGFDISKESSEFSMSGGRIIVETGTPGATADFTVNATLGAGMTGGTVQLGDSTNTLPGNIIKIAGSMPVWNVHSVGSGVSTYIAEEAFSIVNDWTVDNDHTAEFRGNSVTLGGDLTVYGSVDVTNGSSALDNRLLIVNGSGNQTLYYDDAGGLNLYNLRLEKSAGTLVLGGGNSVLNVRNTLEFALGNAAVIDARTNAHYVEMSPSGGSSPQIVRNGQGHVDGRLYRYVDVGARLLSYPVGTSATVSGYSPAVLETVGSGGNAGLVGITAYGNNHPDIANASVELSTNIQRYWNVTTAGSFNLASRTFKLTTQFQNPEDLRGSPNILFFQHHRYTPGCPDPPAACPPGTGTWTTLLTTGHTDSTATSVDNQEFGDFLIAELDGLSFYSRQSGSWDNPNTWSLSGYGGAAAPRYPNQTTDKVFVGNGRRVTVPSTITPEVRSVKVERFNNVPGELFVDGNLGTIRGTSFELEDSCTLGVQHLNGIWASDTKGAIQTDTRAYGVSRYVFYSVFGSQNSGRGVPDSIKAFIVDNQSSVNNTLFISNYAGAPTITIQDTALVANGIFSSGNRNLDLYGDMVLYNNSEFDPLAAVVTMLGNNTHTITLDNVAGVRFNDLVMAGGDVLVNSVLVGSSTANVEIENELRFEVSSLINVRDFGRRVEIATGAGVIRTLNAGHVDGTMRKYIGAAADSTLFEIGNGADYTPALLQLSNAAGTAGPVDAISFAPVPDEPYFGNRLDVSNKIQRYWRLTGAVPFAMGARTANTHFEMPVNDLAGVSTSATLMRRRSIPTEVPEWRHLRGLTWDAGIASVELSASESRWNGLGEFYIGELAQRIFYSRQNGNWNDNTSWSFGGHGGPAVPAGIFPNQDWNLPPGDEYEVTDSVIIGDSDVIRVNTLPEIALLEVASTATLLIENGRYVSESSVVSSVFALRGNATLNTQSSEGIDFGTASGIIRFADTSRVFDPGANYEFTGSSTQVFGGAFPTLVNNVSVNKNNPADLVSLDKSGISVGGILDLRIGTLAFNNTDAGGSPADLDLTLGNLLQIGADATFTVSTSGTPPREHNLFLNGDVINNGGNWLMRPIANSSDFVANVVFTSSATQTIGGSGTNRLFTVTLDKGSIGSYVDASVDIGISAVGVGDAINYINGTWRQSGGTLTFDDGVATPRGQTITANGALHFTGSGSGQIGVGGLGATLTIDGGELLLNTTGEVIVGSASGNRIQYSNAPNNRLTVMNGTLEVAGRISRETATNNRVLDYNQSGGTVIVGTVGHSNSSLGTFDLGANSSSMTMSGGTLILRNANSAASRPADLDVDATSVAISGGTIQFGDASTPAATKFDYNLSNGAAWNIHVATNASVHPETVSAALAIQANLSVDGVFLGTELRNGSAANSAEVTFEGLGAANQVISGSGSTIFNNVTMNRGAGSGVVELLMPVEIAGVLDFQDGANPNNQIIALGDDIDLLLSSSSPNSIVDEGTPGSGPYRYIRTSRSSGRLIRMVTSSGNNYIFPVGSYDNGQDVYTPANYNPTSSGADGTVGVRVSRGGAPDGAHLQLTSATDYLQRYWSIDEVTTTLPGRFRFYYADGPDHITGSENNFARLGRWRPVEEAPGGPWISVNGAFDTGANWFETPAAYPAADYMGDWAIGDIAAFRRLFYSRQSGFWNENTTWTFSASHTGAAVDPGVFPNDAQDSVIIGGGTNGVGNHIVSLQQSAVFGGLMLGTSAVNTGTLDSFDKTLSGDWFVMSTSSTLRIGSPLGISAAPAATGNVITNNRIYSTEGFYMYNGTTNQIIGNGLPSTMAGFIVQNTGPVGNNTVRVNRNLRLSDDMQLLAGVLDLQDNSIDNGPGTGNAILSADTRLRIGGASNLNLALPNFALYTIDLLNTVEYYGNGQTITPAPNGGVGYGNVLVNEAGTKTVSAPVLIRGNLTIANSATLQNDVGVNALEVEGRIYNDATVNNDGVIIIGN